MIDTFTAIGSLPGIDRLCARPPVRLSGRPRRPDDVAGALPLGQRVGIIGEAGLADPLHEPDDLGQLLGQCVQLRAGADMRPAP
jgi:hypothetical protein